MASKRISQSAINWSQFAARVPPQQKPQFQAFKAKSDQYLRSVLQYPAEAPAFDWSFYKAKVPIAGMVDEFQKQYGSLKIPFPVDTVSGQIDAQEKEFKGDIEKFKKDSNARIEGHKKHLAHIASLLPFDQMTMEDFNDSYPDLAYDQINRPTFWPHTPEEQPGYEDEQDKPAAH